MDHSGEVPSQSAREWAKTAGDGVACGGGGGLTGYLCEDWQLQLSYADRHISHLWQTRQVGGSASKGRGHKWRRARLDDC